MGDSTRIFQSMATGFDLISMTVEVAGFFVCWSYRRLSPWTILMAVGFAGLFAAGGLGCLVSIRATPIHPDILEISRVAKGLIGVFSIIAVVFGLGLTFADLHRRLALALEPSHVRR